MRRAGAELVIALVHQTAQEVQVLLDTLPEGTLDAAIAGHEGAGSVPEAGVLPGRAPVFQLSGRGRAVLRLDFTLGEGVPLAVPSDEERGRTARRVEQQLKAAEAGAQGPVREARLSALRQRLEEARRAPTLPDGRAVVAWSLVPLAPGMSEDPSVAAVVERYARDVQVAPVDDSPRECGTARMGQALLIGAGERCKLCHAPAFAQWEATAHAKALATLERVGRSRDLECARCHLTGLFAPGGVCRIDRPQGRQGVQCEACHGPGSAHAEAPARGALVDVREETCRACHTADHDPGFLFERAREKVTGPGHGHR